MLYNNIIEEFENPIITSLVVFELSREETLNERWEMKWKAQEVLRRLSRA